MTVSGIWCYAKDLAKGSAQATLVRRNTTEELQSSTQASLTRRISADNLRGSQVRVRMLHFY